MGICAWAGVRPPFFRLHGAQAVVTFSQLVRPPSRRGITWSKVSSLPDPQYWQANRSRRNRVNRVKAGFCDGFTYWRSAMTLGIGIDRVGDRISRPYFSKMAKRSRNNAFNAVSQG